MIDCLVHRAQCDSLALPCWFKNEPTSDAPAEVIAKNAPTTQQIMPPLHQLLMQAAPKRWPSFSRQIIAYQNAPPATRSFPALRQRRWRNHSFSGRFQSSIASGETSLEMRTNQMLEFESAPLGSMNSEQAKEAMSSINFWVGFKSTYGAKQATRIFRRVINEYAAGNETLRPNYDMIDTVVTSWKDTCAEEYPMRLLEILNRMEKAMNSEEIPYRLLLGALSKGHTEESALVAQEILDRMIALDECGKNAVGLNTLSFNNVITCWTATNRISDVGKAETLLKRMIAMRNNGYKNVQPNCLAFNLVLMAYCRHDYAEKADELLKLMEASFVSGNDSKPDEGTYLAVISTLERCSEPGAGKRAEVSIYRKAIRRTYLRDISRLMQPHAPPPPLCQ